MRIDDLRHPIESSRFALALLATSAAVAVAVFVLVSLGRTTVLWLLLLTIAIVLAVIWLLLQVRRVSILADAVKVSADTVPELQEVLDTVTERLDYRRRIDMFVVEKSNPPLALTSLFGTRVLVAEGGALGDLTDDDDRLRLIFLLATHVGALKARHARWGPFLMALDMCGLGKVVYPFVLPWYRATVYTGDRIAHACVDDLEVSLRAIYKTLVGKEVATHVRAPGLTGQALVVRRRALLRLVQLQRPVPHATNRYLELLAFASSRSEEAAETVRAVTASSPRGVENILNQLRRRRSSVAAIPVAGLLAGTLVLAGLITGLQFRDSPVAIAIDNAWTELNSGPNPSAGPETPHVIPPVEPTPAPNPADSASTPTSPPPAEDTPSAIDTLKSLVPANVIDDCSEAATNGDGELAALTCVASTTDRPGFIKYSLFLDDSTLEPAFESLAGALPDGSCSEDSNVQTTWTYNDQDRGRLACWESGDEQFLMWSDKPNGLLVYADSRMTQEDLYAWWREQPS